MDGRSGPRAPPGPPLYLGRGRGRARGRGRGEPSGAQGGNQRPAWSGKPQNPKAAPRPQQTSIDDESHVQSAEQRFEDARASMTQSVQKHLAEYDSSDEDEDTLHNEQVLASAMKSYSGVLGKAEDMTKTKQYLTELCSSGSAVCLICIATVKHQQAVWSCGRGCYSLFHLQCIQKWAGSGGHASPALSSQNFPNRETFWHCPKCRSEYKQSECPTKYECYCRKEVNPKFDPWLVPHSCGQQCGKKLKPDCGHNCLLLCHPGPCPPCPKMVLTTCYCAKSSATSRRCSTKEWSCGQTCGRALACQLHRCQNLCHAGQCPPCPRESQCRCLCGKETSMRPCASPSWQCSHPCGAGLPCGNHVCERACHADHCGQCPRAGKRTCPCGKSTYQLPCTEDVPTCGDTCEKPLACDLHKCSQRCHNGPCETCRHMVEKKCRCGLRRKTIQCHKEYLCDNKCNKTRDCQKHQCRRKCCDGNCPNCDVACGKTLTCKNHKCPSKCHLGLCYPCPLTVEVKCQCGSSVKKVPCGREKVTKPPKCQKPCKIPSDCHHPQREPHPCHPGQCPACRQVCRKPLPGCKHSCPKLCHDSQLVKTVQKQLKRAGPWEPAAKVKTTIVTVPCPPCRVSMPVACLGKHAVEEWPCCDARPSSCGRLCGRSLACGNHVCTLECHTVTGVNNSLQASAECEQCEGACSKPRPPGCSHSCIEPCHPGPCPPCKLMVRAKCHCQVALLYIECREWTSASEEEKEMLQSCKNTCPRQLDCGHQCSALCHRGDCPALCSKKTTLRCPCKRRKKDFSCNQVVPGAVRVDCDEACQQLAAKRKEEEDTAETERRERETLKQQKELEQFERKFGSKRKRERKKEKTEKEPTFLEKYRIHMKAIIIVTFLALIVIFLSQL